MTGGTAIGERPEISVVVPVYRNETTLAALHSRIVAALDDVPVEVIFVDDASPDRSAATVEGLAGDDPRVKLVVEDRNRGQHAAAISGMRHSRGDWVVVLDADLQDPPEAIPALIAHGRAGFDAVFAGRRGRYESRSRLLTSRLFKAALAAISDVPRDAGMFVALRRSAAQRVIAMEGPPPQVVAMIGSAGLRTASIPVARSPRADGTSAYTTAARVGSSIRALRWALRGRMAADGSDLPPEQRAAHNAVQRRYYAGPPKANMLPRPSRYLTRQTDELVSFAALREGDRVLEVGCGMGRYTLPLAGRGLQIEGIDISHELLDGLRSHAAGRYTIPLHEADVLDPPAELRGRFDAIVGFFVLHHLHDVAACMRSMAQLLAPGGRLAFLEPNAYNPLYYVQIAATPTMSWEGDRGVAQMRRAPLLEALRGAGVEEPRLERFGFFPPFIADRPRAESVERRLERIPPLRPVLPFQLLGGRVGGP
jgi:2-polyprenyl-3-methyl-5-hydroxy-6-metoxy-1,4-benzoquinol methylase